MGLGKGHAPGVICLWLIFWVSVVVLQTARAEKVSGFDFKRDTFAFENSTVFQYKAGEITNKKIKRDTETEKRYTRRCFVMSRAVEQFFKFARFDAKARPVDDNQLAERIRKITHMEPWQPALPANERIIIPGYASLRALSKAKAELMQQHIGKGWPTYARIGNFRMFFLRDSDRYTETQHDELNKAMARGEFFVAYLTDYPHFHINHSVLVYGRIPPKTPDALEHYLVYDPNHSDAPRDLKWSPKLKIFNFQKDEEFVGGFTRVYHVYGKAWQ